MNEQGPGCIQRNKKNSAWQCGLRMFKTLPTRLLIALVLGYRRVLSPLFPPCCRFVPTCSQYALDAIRKHGAIRGALLTIWRLLRCHPFCRGGYDPVK